MNTDIIQSRVNAWLDSSIIDDETKHHISVLQAKDEKELFDAFYKNLEFGTGGLRGIMGVGDNRMNVYTVRRATQGFANYLKQKYTAKITVIVGYDCRNKSKIFAHTTADVFASNGIYVLLFSELRPTPQLSFLIQHYACQGGVVCTASHNPKEYNGYKAYGEDGAQLTPPDDKHVIDKVNEIRLFETIKAGDENQKHLIRLLGEEEDKAYLDILKTKVIHPQCIKEQGDVRIVYTPIHGTGITILPTVLKQVGFNNVHIVEEQAMPDGNFPTVVYPNPEEQEAMRMGLEVAKKIDADLLLGTDPDSDRLAIAVKDDVGELCLLNGNQLVLLAFDYVLGEREAILAPNDMVVKTIVSSPLLDEVAKHYGCKCYNVLTGFKWIAQLIRQKEGKEKYLIGGEESFGLMYGDECRDKDAMSAALLFCEMVAVDRSRGSSLFERLLRIYQRHGFYYETLFSLSRKGAKGQAEIAMMMSTLREGNNEEIAGVRIEKIKDYQRSVSVNMQTKQETKIDLPKSNVLQFELAEGTLISARPSGTEPKIKFYFSVQVAYDETKSYAQHVALATERIKRFEQALHLS